MEKKSPACCWVDKHGFSPEDLELMDAREEARVQGSRHTTRPTGKHAAPYSLPAENLAFFASWGRVLMRQTFVGTHRANVTAVTR